MKSTNNTGATTEIQKATLPLIERILVIGVSTEELSKLFSQKKVDLEEINKLKIRILEEYKSNELKESPNDNYIENITIFCMPEGLKISEDVNNMKTFTHSFSLITSNSKRKHCTCMTFYENYESGIKKVALLKALCLVSSEPIYTAHKEVLNNIYSIVSNYKINKTMFPEQLKYVYLKDKTKSYTVLKEYSILEFYFSFILNSMKYSKEERSYYVNYIGNNAGKKCFLKYHTNDNFGYPLLDFDLTILLDKFNVEDLIKIYLGLLMEYKLILIFDDYQDINTIIFSITSLICPLKWNFPLISFITPTLMETLEAPFAMIIGVHSKYLNIVTQKLNQTDAFTEETLIYNLSNKSFIYMPGKFPELPLKIVNELRSNIYLVLSEKLSLTSDIDNDDTDLFKMFPSIEACKKMDPTAFLNLKFIQVFFNVFLELIKNLDSSIYFSKVKSMKNSKEKFRLYDVFDSNKFINDRDFHLEKPYFSFVEQFSKTLMFMQFLEKYIKNAEKNPKYKFIRKMVTYLSSKENGKTLVKELNRDYIKNKLISYYNFKFISLEDALKGYIDKLSTLSSSKHNSDERLIWNPLENYKIINFSVNFEKYLIKDSDDRLKDNTYKKLYSELLKFKEYKQYEVEGDDDSHTQVINSHEPKMKSYLEENYNPSEKNCKKKIHKSSPSYSFADAIKKSQKIMPTNTIIKCDNNIENYIFNNINISTEELNNRLPVSLNLDAHNNSKLGTSINTGGSIKSIHSMNNSLNSVNSSFKNVMPIFNKDNFSSRNVNNVSQLQDCLKKSAIVNLKQMQTQGKDKINIFEKLDKRKTNTGSSNQTKDITELLRLSKMSNATYRNNNSLFNNQKTYNFMPNSNIDSNKKLKLAIKDPNLSINISPLKRINLLNESSQSIASSQHNLSKLKNVENLSKLAGDEEVDIFSDGEDPSN